VKVLVRPQYIASQDAPAPS